MSLVPNSSIAGYSGLLLFLQMCCSKAQGRGRSVAEPKIGPKVPDGQEGLPPSCTDKSERQRLVQLLV